MNALNTLTHTPAEFLTQRYFPVDSRELVQQFESAGFYLADQAKARLVKPTDPRLTSLWGSYDATKQAELVSKFDKRNTRYLARLGHEKHFLKFKSDTVGLRAKGHDLFVRVSNSYDGSSSLTVSLDMLRLVCLNGLVAPRNMFSQTIKHSNKNILPRTIEAVYKILSQKDILDEQIDRMSSTRLNLDEKEYLIDQMFRIRFPDSELILDSAKKLDLLKPIRQEEMVDNLYQNFNTLQEKLTRGVRVGLLDANGNPISRKIREVKSQLTADDFNDSSWRLAMSLAS